MDLLDSIRSFVALQTALVSALKSALGERDWELLVGVPRSGTVSLNGEEWSYQRHGVGVRFERRGVVVDANRHLDQDPTIFDAGRLVEFLESRNCSEVTLADHSEPLSFASVSVLLSALAARGQVHRVAGLSGELFRLKS
jgi:hypothetical protein